MDVSRHFKAIRLALIPLFLLALSACSKPPSGTSVFPQQSDCTESQIPKEFVVQWKNGTTTLELGGTREEFIEDFVEKNLDKIKHVEHNRRVYVQPYLQEDNKEEKVTPDNWGAAIIKADYAWTNGVRGDGVIVAVIDAGVNINHPNLVNQIAYNQGEMGIDELGQDKRSNGFDDDQNGQIDDYAGFNFVRGSPINSEDAKGHATHISGIIAAEHNDVAPQPGYTQGVAPGAKILPIDFIDENAGGNIIHVLHAIDYSVKMGAKIINASFGGDVCSKALNDRIAQLESEKVLFVAAAGNRHHDLTYQPEYPAAYQNSAQITVGSIAPDDFMAEHSNFSSTLVNIFAPGESIISTVGSGYRSMTGTSMATPFVVGTAALIWSAKPSATLQEVKDLILNNVHANSSYQNSSRGRLDVESSLRAMGL